MAHALPTHPGPSTERLVWPLLAALLVVLVGAIASIGGPLSGLQGPAAAAYWLLASAGPAALYIASGIGLGRLVLPLFRKAREAWAIQAVAGLSLQLSIGHGINCVGAWLPGYLWNLVSLAPGALGLVLLIASLRRPPREASGGSRIGLWMIAPGAFVLALAVMLVAAMEAPGILWSSEFGGFDVLSYHLQLPREWLELGRLTPLNHNVYSYLPSYFESAFLTLQLWTFAPRSTVNGVSGILANDGWRAISCQLLHVGFGVVAAWMVAAATRETLARTKEGGEGAPHGAGWVGAAAFLCVPWIVVVGSMAYNELAMCSLIAGAMVAALDRGIGATSRAVLTGWLIGVACGLKPTALVLAAPMAGLALIWFSPARGWIRLVAYAAGAGFIALAPWLLRNWFASGNPIFPYAHGLFGDAHWTAEQYARFAHAHQFEGSWSDRLKMLIFIDPNDPAGARHRGLMHPQWSAFFPIVGAAAVIGLVARSTRQCTGLLVASLAVQILAWLTLTHLQSRFLIPLAIPGAMLIGLAASGAWLRAASRRRDRYALLAITATSVCTGFMAMRSLDAFWSEQGGNPNQALGFGPQFFAQTSLREGDTARVAPGETLYLLGDSTPFYVPGPLVYHTTWDASPLGDAVRTTKESENAPFEWSGKLLDRGIDAVLINFSELGRLIEIKWYDPAISRDVLTRWFPATVPAGKPKSSGQDLPPVVRPIRAPESRK
ncbi:MAG: hypothetical protein KF691_15405 [Phycisphaeraceae bacterium]|nr:hypothetical protein [Phycisphaeraceae bacterium]